MSKKYTSHDDIIRVIQCHRDGLTTKEIEASVGVKQRTVQNLIKKYKASGSKDLPLHSHGGGHSPKVSPRTLSLLKRRVETNPALSAKQLKVENPNLLGETSVRTVQRCLHDKLGFKKVTARRKPLITDRQRKNRLAFAKKYADWDLVKWREVLWTDEATFRVTDSNPRRVWKKKGADPLDPRLVTPTVKFPAYHMVWGSFGYGGLGELVFLPKNETLNANGYYTLLNDHLPASFEKSKTSILQQDGAPCHKARSVTEWLEDSCVEFIPDWPGNSPDLSPIENIWAVMKQRLQGVDTTTLPKLEAAVRSAWNSISLELCQTLADSVPKRLQEARQRGGGITRH